MISSFFGEVYGNSWRKLVSPTFHHKSGDIHYTVGQPIGFLSSWSVFSLAHHYVVFIAGKSAGVTVRNKYVLLGDDIVIADDVLAEHYRRMISRLGVEISPLKTHVSYDTYEFAKRWYKDKEEISPFPILSFSNKHYTTILAGILASRERGWDLKGFSIEEAAALFSSMITGHYGPGYMERAQGMFTLYYSVYRAIKG